MRRTALRNKEGMTLVEVMVGLVVLLFVSLAMMQTALVSIDSGMVNVIRDEAVSLADSLMDETKNTSFDTLTCPGGWNPSWGVNWEYKGEITKNIRNITNLKYYYWRGINCLDTDTRQISIWLSWSWKGSWYNHNISTIAGRQ